MKYPDYEAAADAFIEKLKELSAGTGEMVALGVEMRMIVAAVDAALEGEPLYRRVDECTECAYAGDDGDVMCYLGLPHDWFVQVNQEGEQR